jgi:hypothetical protein
MENIFSLCLDIDPAGLIRTYGCFRLRGQLFGVPIFLLVLALPFFIFISEPDMLYFIEIIYFMKFFDSFLIEVMLKIALLHIRMLLLHLLNPLRNNGLQNTLLHVDRAAHNNASKKK